MRPTLSLFAVLLSTAFPPIIMGVSTRATNSSSAVIDLHRSLVEIDSTTSNEATISAWLASYLMSQNWTVITQPVPANSTSKRANVYAHRGTSRSAAILLTSHIDTVPPFIPYTYHETNATITGRGTNDAKSAVAAQIIAANSLPDADLALLYVVGEETGGDGMAVANSLSATWSHAVIFGEPTEGLLSRGHKGRISAILQAVGKAAHSAYPELGIDANARLVDALYAVNHAADKLPVDEILGRTTVNAGVIAGGTAANVISPAANASVAVRVVSTVAETMDVLEGIVEDVEGVSWRWNGDAEPVELDAGVEGFEEGVQSYGTDIPGLKLPSGVRRYLYGPGSIHSAHGPDEFVTVADLEAAVEGYRKLVLYNLEKGPGEVTAAAAQ